MSVQRMRRRGVVLGGAALVVSAPFAACAPVRGEGEGEWFHAKPLQGALMVGRAGEGARVWVESEPVRVSDGLFVFGIGRDDTKPIGVRAAYRDGHSVERTVTPIKRDFPVERIDHLPEELVNPTPAEMVRIRREAEKVAAARAHDTGETWFTEAFDWPAMGPISGVYGSQRILNGEPKTPHYGVDIAAPEGAPVHAPVNAVVSLAEADFYLTGGTVVLDHGHGVSTTYLHMSRVDVKAGDELNRGDQFGAVGHTGRATGPHLHWAMNWFQVRLDPSLVALSPAPSKA